MEEKESRMSSLEHGVSGKGRNRSRNVGSGNKRHDGNHCQTSIVQFTVLLLLQCGSINRREVNRREDDGGQGSSLGVVCAIGFGNDFGKEDQSDDLLLSCNYEMRNNIVIEYFEMFASSTKR